MCVQPQRYGPPAVAGDRDRRHAGHHHAPDGAAAETVAQPVKIDNDLYVRDYSRCIMCYKCVKACGTDAQFTFAIAAAGRGFDTRIATEYNAELPDSACVYCGNCIGVCPTGALKSVREHELRESGQWDPAAETVTTTICSFCGVGCNLELHVQRGHTLWSVQVHHQPYPLHEVHLLDAHDELVGAVGIRVPNEPPLAHFATGVDVEVFPPRLTARYT